MKNYVFAGMIMGMVACQSSPPPEPFEPIYVAPSAGDSGKGTELLKVSDGKTNEEGSTPNAESKFKFQGIKCELKDGRTVEEKDPEYLLCMKEAEKKNKEQKK